MTPKLTVIFASVAVALSVSAAEKDYSVWRDLVDPRVYEDTSTARRNAAAAQLRELRIRADQGDVAEYAPIAGVLKPSMESLFLAYLKNPSEAAKPLRTAMYNAFSLIIVFEMRDFQGSLCKVVLGGRGSIRDSALAALFALNVPKDTWLNLLRSATEPEIVGRIGFAAYPTLTLAEIDAELPKEREFRDNQSIRSLAGYIKRAEDQQKNFDQEHDWLKKVKIAYCQIGVGKEWDRPDLRLGLRLFSKLASENTELTARTLYELKHKDFERIRATGDSDSSPGPKGLDFVVALLPHSLRDAFVEAYRKAETEGK